MYACSIPNPWRKGAISTDVYAHLIPNTWRKGVFFHGFGIKRAYTFFVDNEPPGVCDKTTD